MDQRSALDAAFFVDDAEFQSSVDREGPRSVGANHVREEAGHAVPADWTAYAADDLIHQGLMEGIKTVLTKPLDIDFLLILFSAYKRLIVEDT